MRGEKPLRRRALALLLAAAYQVSYPIEWNLVTLPEEIAAFHNRESEDWDPSEITVYDGVGVGNREYYLIEMGEYLGSVALRRSLTGRHKIEYLKYGDRGHHRAVRSERRGDLEIERFFPNRVETLFPVCYNPVP